MRKVVFALALFCLFLSPAGCRKKQLQPGIIVADKQVALAAMAPGDVIVSVNGKALTRKDYDDSLDLQIAIYSMRRPSANKQAIDVYRANREVKIISDYVNQQLVLQEGQRMGIRVPPKALDEATLKAWRNISPRKAGDDLTAVLGPKVSLFKKFVSDDEHARATRSALFGDRLDVSEADIDQMEKKMADWNAVYADSNRVVMARGEEIVRELRAGADFVETAKRVSQFRPEEGELWGEFTHAEIEDKALREVAFQLPVGNISDPVDTEDGLVIIRVLERSDGATVQSSVARQIATVKLARILLLMYNPFNEMNRDEIRTTLLKDRNTKIQQEWMPKLFEAARIEYPNGTNLWPQAKSQTRRNR